MKMTSSNFLSSSSWCQEPFSLMNYHPNPTLITASCFLFYLSLYQCISVYLKAVFSSRWANSLAWVIVTFHTFLIDRCLNYCRIKNRQRIQKERENTSKNIRFSCTQPTQTGVTACYCAMLWDMSAAIISWPGCCLGGLLRHSQHICAQQWLHFLLFLCTWWNCILSFTEANT